MYEPRDRDLVLHLAARLQEGVAPWRVATAVRTAVEEWVREAVDSEVSESRAIFVADEGGKVVGFVTTSTRRHFAGDLDAYVGELVVDRRAERRGIGRMLMAAAEDWARKQGLAHISLDTGAANAHARAFYRALGYQEEDVKLTKPLRPKNALLPGENEGPNTTNKKGQTRRV
jgi:ribosomal protein S18 acetylase RimI-like enzyme